MNRMVESVLEIFIGVVLLLALAGFIATANTTQLGTTASLVVGLLVTIMAIGLMWRAVQGFMSR
jgi:membrane protein implicated in regulation of membrane protease activity